ncbi:hypothetical protein T492DRAFT_1086580 [Pavlovales sp. CCMP2436]|nr:hypothetical protein T492DRAFT_1086580 [Pavlovales sp. CCMP2436]
MCTVPVHAGSFTASCVSSGRRSRPCACATSSHTSGMRAIASSGFDLPSSLRAVPRA